MKVAGKSHLPAPVSSGGPYIRCKCRPTATLARDIAMMEMERLPPVMRPPPDVANKTSGDSDSDVDVSDDWLQAAAVVASQYDNVQPSTLGKHVSRLRDTTNNISESQPKPAAPRKSCVDGFQGAIISIGAQTDGILDRFDLDDSIVPQLRVLTQTVRSSRWEAVLRSSQFGLTYEQASKLTDAILKDIGSVRNVATQVSFQPTLFNTCH